MALIWSCASSFPHIYSWVSGAISDSSRILIYIFLHSLSGGFQESGDAGVTGWEVMYGALALTSKGVVSSFFIEYIPNRAGIPWNAKRNRLKPVPIWFIFMGRQIRTVVSRILAILINVRIRIFAVNPDGRLQTMRQDIFKYKANSKRQREEKAGNLGLWICFNLVQVENPPYLLFSAALPNHFWAFARYGDGTYPPVARVITTNQGQRRRAWLGKQTRFGRIP